MMGYTETNVTVLESGVVAKLTIAISSARAIPIEIPLSLLVNATDGTATGLPWSVEFLYL